jgi:VanZ family protein
MPSISSRNGSLLVAVLVSAAVVLAAPFLGQLRAYLRAAFPGAFVTIVGGAVAVAVAAAVVVAVTRIRHARLLRYAVIAAAAATAVGYSWATRSGIADVDIVERVHFIEYGAIALLFYRAFRSLGDLGGVAVPVLAALTAGTLDEWLQWFIPNRVGEARDVFLNLVAIGCGLAFASALEPPATFTLRWQPRSRRVTAVAGAVFFVVFAGFVNAVHLGHLVRDDEVAFRSHYTLAELERLARDRHERWRVDPPTRLIRLSREDQYLDEGLWHVRERNERWDAQDFAAAAMENAILERYFAPVIDTPSYAAPAPSRWPAAQAADARLRGTPRPDLVSEAEPYPIVTVWGEGIWWFWALIAVLTAAVLVLGYRVSGQRPRAPQ